MCLAGEVVCGRFILILYGCVEAYDSWKTCIHRLRLGQVVFYGEADFFFFFLALGWDQKREL